MVFGATQEAGAALQAAAAEACQWSRLQQWAPSHWHCHCGLTGMMGLRVDQIVPNREDAPCHSMIRRNARLGELLGDSVIPRNQKVSI